MKHCYRYKQRAKKEKKKKDTKQAKSSQNKQASKQLWDEMRLKLTDEEGIPVAVCGGWGEKK